ncbi:signal recognition particle-docking protein FtsY [Bifidobacterium pseudolongum]|uniref:Signal recognition particle receptor FtsY n=1 Tax=Bifidobacterium pseudolongum TaxID=1694 RepID=A0A4S4FDX4_9BIFI|nr:signal recognition particle-docking protein FtsY [Bifidobacterium pseudolongum]THG27126.1 signal recognition particle-docking protein FtsY [Bifidobacterium pseudolongum]
MDTNMVYGIIAVVVIAVLLIVGGIWMDRSRKKNIQQSQEAAKAKADERLAAERAAQKPTVPEPAEAKRSPAEQTPDALAPPAEAPVEEVETVEETGVVEEPVPPVEKPEGKKGRLQRLRERLSKSGNPFGKALFNILAKDHLSETDWEDVEDTLLLADVGAEASEQLVEQLRTDARVTGETDPTQLREALRGELLALVDTDVDRSLEAEKPGAKKPSVIIMVGVNGTGKTTTAGKLARLFVSEDKTVMLGAADTFRAAAADQLETWGAKVDVPVVRSDKEGADPASVAFEAAAKAKDDDVDVLIIDTAGRLQNKANLMDELGKIRRVTEKNLPVDEVLLVLDATTGQNGMAQAKVFAEAIGITGVVLTKLDGSAKGGIVISVQKELGVPVKLVGVGEGPDDLAPFDPESFVDGILG